MSTEIAVETAHGPGRLVLDEAATPAATLLLSHGAGNGIDTRDLEALSAALPGEGITVARFEQPWRVAGRPVASPPKTLDAGFTAAAGVLRLTRVAGPLVVGGRSAGARSACRTAAALGAAGVLALAFPLHPPGKGGDPAKSRAAELETGLPTLVIQGERDVFGGPDGLPDGVEVVPVPGADHGFKVLKSGPIGQDDALAIVVESSLEWLVREILGALT